MKIFNHEDISQQLCFSAGKMYSTMCVEWAKDHSGVGLM